MSPIFYFGGRFTFMKFQKKEDVISDIIKKHTATLHISSSEISKFTNDFIAQMPKKQLNTIITLHSLTPLLLLLNKLHILQFHPFFEDTVVSLFLLSTNYFNDKQNEKQADTIRYRTFYNPNKGCSNPLFTIDNL